MKTPSSNLIVLLSLLSVGCQKLDTSQVNWTPWKKKSTLEQSEYQRPERMVVIWTDAIYRQMGARPTRGFGGRIYFYNSHNQAVPVNGQLVVYAYDDSKQNDSLREPDRRFVFTPEQFTKHYSESELGASYSVWIPWGDVSGEEMQISLLPIFTSETGNIVNATMTCNVLPGKKRLTDQERRGFYVSPRAAPPQQMVERQPGPRQVGFFDPPRADGALNGASPALQQPMKTTTIRVPLGTQERMARAQIVTPLPGRSPHAGPQAQQAPPQQTRYPVQPAAYPGPITAGAAQQAMVGAQPNWPPAEARATRWPQAAVNGQVLAPVPGQGPPTAPQSSIRFEPPRFQAPTLPMSQPDRGHGQIPHSPLGRAYHRPQ